MCTIDDLGSSPPLRKETLILIVMCTCRRSDSNARNQQHPRTSLRRAQQVHVPPPPSDALNQHWVYSCAAAAGPGDAARQFHTPPRQFHSSNDGERAEAEGSYSVAVHGRCMIAHSFEGECFGPAQAPHGCTYVVDAIVEGPKLQTGANYLVDFCPKERALHDALGCYRECNLDELVEFAGENTMCERVARAVWERMAAALPGPPVLAVLRVVVHESDVAHVEYERALGADATPALYTVSVRGRFMAARASASRSSGCMAAPSSSTRSSRAQRSTTGPTTSSTSAWRRSSCEGPPRLCSRRTSTVTRRCCSRLRASPMPLRAAWPRRCGPRSRRGCRRPKLVVAEHDASIAEYNGRLGHAPTLPTPMRRALERRLMEKELPWCESGWPLIAEDDPLIVPMMTGYSTGANLELDPLAPVLPVGTTIRTSVTRSFSLFNDNGAERMWALARGGAAGRTRGAPGPRCCARPSDGHAACRGGLERHHHDDAARPRQPAAVPSLCRESARLQRALTHKPRLHVGGSCRRAVYHVEVNPMLRRWKRG